MYKLGSNQFKKQRKSTWKKTLLFYGFGVSMLVFPSLYLKTLYVPQAHAQVVTEPTSISEVIIKSKVTKDMITPTPSNTPIQEQEIAYIKEVFQSDSSRAFALLSCENYSLNPEAVNHNTDQAQSTDYGLFQINNHWQGVTNTDFLFDYKINTLMAKKIFDAWGHTFKAWTCGKELGL